MNDPSMKNMQNITYSMDIGGGDENDTQFVNYMK